MNEKQKRFCDYYLEFANISKASLKAGYSRVNGSRLLKKDEIKEYLASRLSTMDKDKIANVSEIMKYLTKVMRGEEEEEVIVIEKCGEGFSSARNLKKKINVKERLKAAELLGKRYSIFNKESFLENSTPIIISGEDSIKK